MKILDAIAAESGPLFIVGSCKNSGKTTLLNFLNADLFDRVPRRRVGLTTIGRDGEPEDAVWRHPKPPVNLWPDDLFVTTQPELEKLQKAAALEENLPFTTVLGPIVLGRALRSTKVEIIGPGNNAQLAYALDRLRLHGSDIQLVDGAFERRTQVACLDDARLALVVGADIARTPKAAAEWLAFQLELYALRKAADFPPLPADAPLGLHWRQGNAWSDSPLEAESVACVGPLSDRLVEKHLDDFRDRPLIVEDATKLFLDARHWRMLKRRCPTIAVRRPLRLILAATNPAGVLRQFKPQEFFDALREACPTLPLLDVVAGLFVEP